LDEFQTSATTWIKRKASKQQGKATVKKYAFITPEDFTKQEIRSFIMTTSIPINLCGRSSRAAA
jgi:hypothetical protein